MSSVSQSVSRCFAIFALFSARQAALTAVEIAEHLDAPRSSVAALLKELVELRMLSLNRRTLTYMPTLGFARLSAWLTDPRHFPPQVAAMMEELQRDSGETVTVSWPLDSEMEVIRVERSRQPISFIAESGQRIPLWTSAVGTAYLATLTNTQVIARWEKDERRSNTLPAIGKVLERVAEARLDGVTVMHSGVFEGASAIAKKLEYELDGRPLVLSIAGPEERMRAREGEYRRMIGDVSSGPHGAVGDTN